MEIAFDINLLNVKKLLVDHRDHHHEATLDEHSRGHHYSDSYTYNKSDSSKHSSKSEKPTEEESERIPPEDPGLENRDDEYSGLCTHMIELLEENESIREEILDSLENAYTLKSSDIRAINRAIDHEFIEEAKTELFELKAKDSEKPLPPPTTQSPQQEVNQILERISDAFYSLDSSWRFTYVNAQFEKVTGRSRGSVIGKTIWNEFPATIGTAIEAEYKRALKDQCDVDFVYHYGPLEKWFRIRAYASRNGLSVYSENVTVMQHALDVLKDKEQWLSATLDSIGDAVITTTADESESVVYMNPMAIKLTGWSFEEAKGQSLHKVLEIIDYGEVIEPENPIQLAANQGISRPTKNHKILISRDKSEYVIEDRIAPVLRTDGTISEVVIVFRNITAEHNLKEQANLLARVAHTVPSFVSLARPNGQVIFVNQHGRNLMGISPEDRLDAVNIKDFFEPNERSRIEAQILPKLARDGSWNGEVAFSNFKTHEKIESLWNIFSIRDGNRNVTIALAWVSTDLRVTKKIEAKKEAHSIVVENERLRFFNLFYQAPIAIAVLEGPEHRFVMANPFAIKMLFGERDLLGKTVSEAIPEDCVEMFLSLLNDVYKTGDIFKGEEMFASFMQSDGLLKDFYLNIIYQPIFDVTGSIEGILAVCSDVTADVRARNEIKMREEKFRTLANSMAHLVWTTTDGVKLDYVNQGLREYTGIKEEDVHNWREANFVHPDDLENTIKIWLEACSQGILYECENRLRRHDGEYRWFLVRAVPFKDANGNIIRWYGSSTDIQSQKLLLEELEQSKTIAENATKAKSSFLANMSHEIRTPLAAILGFTNFLLNPNQTEIDRQEWTKIIRRNAEQLSQLIDELLDISKIEADRLLIEKMTFNLEEVISEVDKLLSYHAKGKGLSLRFISDGPIQKYVHSDPMRLRQILINIVGNAIKFTDAGFVEVRITMIKPPFRNHPIYLNFCVTDTGIGLTADQRIRIWEPFVQADSSMTRKFGGTGLGLSISKKYAQALGGDLWLHSSQLGLGSVFCFTLEAGPMSHEPYLDASADDQTIILRKSSPAPQTQSLFGLNLLVVEDSADNRMLVTRVLSDEGASVEVAVDGMEGVEKALAEKFDAILMDVQMPRLDGYEATRRLRLAGIRAPIIALTAHAMKGDRERAIEAGFDDHLAKPIDHKMMCDKINFFFKARQNFLPPDLLH